MATYTEILTQTDTNAQRPLEMEQDGRRAKQFSLREQIAYLRYKQAMEADTDAETADGYLNHGVRTCRIEPGGAA